MGNRPTNSGMRPYFSRSCACSSRSILVVSLVRVPRGLLLKPIVRLPRRCSMIFSRPSNAPPQMNRMLVVLIWMKSWWGCLRPPCLGEQERFHSLENRLLGDHAALDVGPARNLEHAVEQDILDNRLESAGAGAARKRAFGDGAQCTLVEHQFDVIEREELLVLLDECVLRLGEDADDVLLIEVIQRHGDRQPADE